MEAGAEPPPSPLTLTTECEHTLNKYARSDVMAKNKVNSQDIPPIVEFVVIKTVERLGTHVHVEFVDGIVERPQLTLFTRH